MKLGDLVEVQGGDVHVQHRLLHGIWLSLLAEVLHQSLHHHRTLPMPYNSASDNWWLTTIALDERIQ